MKIALVSFFGTRDPALPAEIEVQVPTPRLATCNACGGLIAKDASGVAISVGPPALKRYDYYHAPCYLDALRATPAAAPRTVSVKAALPEPVVLHVDLSGLSRLGPNTALVVRETRKRTREAAEITARIASPIKHAIASTGLLDPQHTIVDFDIEHGVARCEAAICAYDAADFSLLIIVEATWPIARPSAFVLEQWADCYAQHGQRDALATHGVRLRCLTREDDAVMFDVDAFNEALDELASALCIPARRATSRTRPPGASTRTAFHNVDDAIAVATAVEHDQPLGGSYL